MSTWTVEIIVSEDNNLEQARTTDSLKVDENQYVLAVARRAGLCPCGLPVGLVHYVCS